MSAAEIGARQAMAAAVLNDFQWETAAYGPDPVDFLSWSRRLAAALGGLLAAMGAWEPGRPPSGTGPAPPAGAGAAGPVETHEQARELPGVAETYEAARASRRRGVMDERNHQLLSSALAAAGVELGTYDYRIVAWLSQWEPEVVAVVAGWAGRAALPAPPKTGDGA